jgi:hypothetical protein
MKIRWLRILVAALLYEVALIALTIPLTLFISMEALVPAVPVIVFVVGFPAGMWVSRTLTSGFVLHGTLVGIVATVMYLGLILGTSGGSLQPVIDLYGPVAFFLSNALKVVGCAVGSYAAGRSRATVHA